MRLVPVPICESATFSPSCSARSDKTASRFRRGDLPQSRTKFATEGICVAIPGSDMHLPADMFDPDTDMPADEYNEKLEAFYEHLEPLRETGHVWIGGWRNNEGVFELNATVVFREEDQDHATRLAHQWRQESVFDLGRGEVIDIGGDGGESIYDQPGRLQRWFRRR